MIHKRMFREIKSKDLFDKAHKYALRYLQEVFDRPVFHETVLKLGAPVADVLRALEAQGIIGGYQLTDDYPELGEALLVCATETRTEEDIQQYSTQLERVVVTR